MNDNVETIKTKKINTLYEQLHDYLKECENVIDRFESDIEEIKQVWNGLDAEGFVKKNLELAKLNYNVIAKIDEVLDTLCSQANTYRKIDEEMSDKI